MTPLEITLFIALAYIIIGIVLLCIFSHDIIYKDEVLRTLFLWPLILMFAAVFWLIDKTQKHQDYVY